MCVARGEHNLVRIADRLAARLAHVDQSLYTFRKSTNAPYGITRVTVASTV